MLKELVKVANKLDILGLTKEADVIDNMMRRIASSEETPYVEYGSGNYGIFHLNQKAEHAISWFDTLEEAERQLATGWFPGAHWFGDPYIVTRAEEKSSEKPKPKFLDMDGDPILSKEDIAKLSDDVLSFMVEAESLDEETRQELEGRISDMLLFNEVPTVEGLRDVIESVKNRPWRELEERLKYYDITED